MATKTSGRAIGKRMALIKVSAETQTPILVKDTKLRKIYREKARELGLTIPDPLVMYEMIQEIINSDDNKITNVIINDDAYCLKQLLERYCMKDLKAYVMCDYTLPEDEWIGPMRFTVGHYIDKTKCEYNSIKIIDGSDDNVLFEKNEEVIVDDIPDELREMIITNIMLSKNNGITINIGDEISQGEMISEN